MPTVFPRAVFLPSGLRRGGRLAACCCVFPVGVPRKRFPDDASLRLTAILEHHSRGDGILPPKATKVSESQREIVNLTPAVNFLACESFLKVADLGQDTKIT